MPSISSTFFVQTLFFYVHVTRKKLPKRCLYEKFARKTLMKLTPGLYNTRISLLWSFFLVLNPQSSRSSWIRAQASTRQCSSSLHDDSSQRQFAKRQLQWKYRQWQPGINFPNILRAAFSYGSVLHSFYVITVWVCNFLANGNWAQVYFRGPWKNISM